MSTTLTLKEHCHLDRSPPRSRVSPKHSICFQQDHTDAFLLCIDINLSMFYEAEEAMVTERSRITFTLVGDEDERDPPECRDDSQPLDILTMELTALKMGQDSVSVNHHLHYSPCPKRTKREGNSFDRIRNARDTLLAEMEVRKTEKTGIFFLSTQRTTPSLPPTTGAWEPRPGYISVTEKDSIPATKGLVSSRDTAEKLHQTAIKSTAENIYSLPKATTNTKTSIKQASDKRPPLPPRSRPPIRQMVEPLAPMQKTIIDSPNRFRRNTGPRGTIDARLTSEKNDYHDLIVIGSEDENQFQNYQEPVFINLENADSRDLSEIGYKCYLPEKKGKEFDTSVLSVFSSSTCMSIDTLVAARPEQSERIVSPCQHSSIVKSAYVLDATTQGSSAWPKELVVSTDLPVPVTSASPHSTGDHIDLSQIMSEEYEAQCNEMKIGCTDLGVDQMDPDELEAEYARLITTKHGSVTTRDSAVNLDVHDITTLSKRKPLDEIRKLSVVSAVASIDDQDTQKTLTNRAQQEIYSGAEETVQIAEKVGEAEAVVGTDPPEIDQKTFLVGETTQEFPLIFGRDGSSDERVAPQMNEPHLAYENDDDSTASDEQDQYIFVLNATGNTKQESTRIHMQYDFSAVDRIVADYFGGETKLAEAAADPGTSKVKRSMFNNITIGGCCMGLSP